MISVFALGAARIEAAGMVITPTSPRKFALLLRLAAEAGRRISRVSLAQLVFPEQEPTNASHSLRELIYQLRKAGVPIEGEQRSVWLTPENVCSDFDAAINRRGLTGARLTAIQGGFLPGFASDSSEEFSDWFEGFRTRIVSALSRTLLSLAQSFKAECDWSNTESAVRACLALEPFHEEATLLLAESLAASGAKLRAVRLLDDYLGEVSDQGRGLRIPAQTLRTRISERVIDSSTSVAPMRFVGRKREILELGERLQSVRAGSSRCVVVRGEAGIGKSRLVDEFVSAAVLDGCGVVRAGAQPLDTQRTMSAFVDLAPQLLALPGAIGCSPESLNLLKMLTHHDGGLAASHQSEHHRDESAGSRANRIARAIFDVVDAVAAESPLIVVIEDAHWLDNVSLAMTRSLATRGGTAGVFIVITMRPETDLSLVAQPHSAVSTLDLEAIDTEARMMLLSDALPNSSESNIALRDWIADASGGNPFFLDCILAHHASTGERFVIPTRINGLVDQRLNALTPDAMNILHAIHSLGKYSNVERLMSIIDMPFLPLLAAVRELEERRLVTSSPSIAVAHWLIAEAVDRRDTPIVSRIIHTRIASQLQSEAELSGDAGMIWSCAEHWVLAAQTSRATTALRACADHTLAIGRAREASLLLLRAATQAGGEQRKELLESAIRTAGAAVELDVVLRAADALGPQTGDPLHDDTELAVLVARSAGETSRESQSVRHLRRCIQAENAADEHRLGAGLTLLMLCDRLRSPQLAQQVYQTLQPLYVSSMATHADLVQKSLLVYHSCFGDIDRVIDHAQQVIRIAADAREDFAADLYRKAAIGFWRGGESRAAIKAFEKAFESAANCGSARLQIIVALILASNSFDLGMREMSAEWLRTAETCSEKLGLAEIENIYGYGIIDICVGLRDTKRLLKIYDIIEPSESGGSGNRERWYHALGLYLRQTRGEPIDIDLETRRLALIQSPGFELGESGDFETSVVANVLHEQDRTADARALIANYFNVYRRPRTPISATLRAAIEIVGFEGIPDWVARIQ